MPQRTNPQKLGNSEIRPGSDERSNGNHEEKVLLFGTFSQIKPTENERCAHREKSEERRRNDTEFRNESESDERGNRAQKRSSKPRGEILAVAFEKFSVLSEIENRKKRERADNQSPDGIERRARELDEGVSDHERTARRYAVGEKDEGKILRKLPVFKIEGGKKYERDGKNRDCERCDRSISKEEKRRDEDKDRRHVFKRHERRELFFLINLLLQVSDFRIGIRIYHGQEQKP